MLERMKQKRNEGGFTLIELLIVIIILAILAAIVVFAVGNTSQSAAKASCISDAKSVETAIESYKAEHPGVQSTNGTEGYPNSSTELLQSDTVDGATVGPWLKTWPSSDDYQISFNTLGSVWVTGPLTSDGLGYYSTGDVDLNPNQACNVAQAS
jgi:prepilin-type N-terminal cleavage/methylation domain-containing protein